MAGSPVELAQHGRVAELGAILTSQPTAVNAPDEEGCYLLHWAAINGRGDTVKLLLGRGADATLAGGLLNEVALQWAIRQGKAHTAALLLDHGRDADAQARHRGKDGLPALHLAVSLGEVRSVQLLAARNPVLASAVDARGRTPVMVAVAAYWDIQRRTRGGTDSAADVLRTLLALGAPIGGYVPFHVRCLPRFIPRAHPPLRRPEPVRGDSVLHLCVRLCLPGAVVSELLLAGADPAATNLDGVTAEGLAKAEEEQHDGNSKPVTFGKAALRALAAHRANSYTPRAFAACVPCINLGTCVSLPGLGLPGPVSVAVSAVVCAASSAGLGVLGPRASMGCQFGVSWGATAYIAATYVVYVAPTAHPAASLLYAALVTGLAASLYLAHSSDPGFLDRPASPHGRRASIRSLELSGLLFAKNTPICATCCVVKPRRAKHDPTTGRCVCRFDHYCPFVGNAVGGGNHRAFVAFLVFAVAAIALHLVLAATAGFELCYGDVRESARESPDAFHGAEADGLLDDSIKAMAERYDRNWRAQCLRVSLLHRPALVGMWWVALLLWVWITALLGQQVSFIAKGVTTYESIVETRGLSNYRYHVGEDSEHNADLRRLWRFALGKGGGAEADHDMKFGEPAIPMASAVELV